ncbi:hypothetical protein SAMN02745166_01823 [Prosthecobacter debontii]|uniref:Uncharacterized protein n=1 Tax=Prosthecobacter debontii TaxID=48467 RepID=A0A1T4XR53_9BACT|nr:hypothetical protein [Prosthecobacter debontii]SKA92032.1 hypothetical protein SAMN02745166_01823 [Prosthecobacter debontii]
MENSFNSCYCVAEIEQVNLVGSPDSSNAPTPAETGFVPVRGNPFASDVCPSPLGVTEDGSVGALNEDVLDQLLESVENRTGRPLMLLTAPRAGYGKTHLLGRVVAAAGPQVIMVPLAFRTGDTLNLSTTSRRSLESLHLAKGEAENWSRLRELCAGLVAHLLHDLIKEGLVPSANPEQALRVLKGSPVEVFQKEGSAHMIGEWLRKHSSGLRPILARRVTRELPLRPEVADEWLSLMIGQAFAGGTEGLAAMLDLTAKDSCTGSPLWLRLLSIWRPVVLLVDHLDGYYRNPDAGVTIAAMLMDLVDSQGLHVLLSLNQDVWQATFGQHLPSALEDRLTASQMLLRGLREADAMSLLRLRLEQGRVSKSEVREFESFVDVRQYFLGRPVGSVSARVFLRHCARQWEIFQNSVPVPTSGAASSSVAEAAAVVPPPTSMPPPLPAVEPMTSAVPPLMTETVAEEEPAPKIPSIFDAETATELQQMAETLADPKPALPQDELPPPVSTSAPDPFPEREEVTSPPAATDWQAAEPSDEEASSSTAKNAPTPGADAFVKLREMLHHLRQPGGRAKIVDDPADIPPERLNLPVTAPTVAASASGSAPVAPQPPAPTPVPPSRPGDALLGRFEALRLQMIPQAESQALDYTRLGDLVRLAGRRFPLVRLTEHELPGMTGRHTLVWSLQGVELLFGLASFADTAYWRVLAGFAAGRLTDIHNDAERDGVAPAKFKLVTFKSDREQNAWQNLVADETIPDPLKPHLDAVHLDSRSVAALYAMQRIIKDAETGTVQAEPTQVMTVLARELDFFWKRITRS